MKKILFGVPVVAALAGGSWAGTTLISGNETRDAYERLISDMSDALGFELIIASYTAGFLSSEAVTEVRLPDNGVLAKLKHVIQHSPIETGSKTGLSASRITTTLLIEDDITPETQELLNGFSGKEPLVLQSRVGFDGVVNNQLTLAAYNNEVEEKFQIDTEDSVWEIDVDENGGFVGHSNWGGGVMNGPDFRVSMAGSSETFDFTRTTDGLYVGDYEYKLPEVVINSPASGMQVAMRDLGLASTSKVENNLFSGMVRMSIDDVDAPIALDSMTTSVNIGNLSMEHFDEIKAISAKMNAATFSGDTSNSTELLASYFEAFSTMVKTGSFFGIDFALGNGGGDADANATLTFEGDGSASGFEQLTSPGATLGDLIAALKVDVKIDASRDALELTPAALLLGDLPLEPFLVYGQEGLQGDVVIDDMVINANGQEIPLQAMLGPMLDQPLDWAALFDQQ